LVGTDIFDPSGWRATRKQAIPVVVVSAYHDPEAFDFPPDSPVLGYLVKPIERNDLGPAELVEGSLAKASHGRVASAIDRPA
jgi:hypothetical protein